MAGDADFIPYAAPEADFIPYQAPAESAAPKSAEPRLKLEPPAKAPTPATVPLNSPGAAEKIKAYSDSPNSNPFSKFTAEAENLTEEGKKAHPIEALYGKVASGLTDTLSTLRIIAKMSPLLMGTCGGVAGSAAPHSEVAPITRGGIMAGSHPVGVAARGESGITYPVARQAPREAASVPAAGPQPQTPPNAAGKVDVVAAGPATGGTMRPTPEEVAPPSAEQKLLPAAPGPAGPTIETPPEAYPAAGAKPTTSKMIKDLVNQAYGVKPLEPDVPLREQIDTETPATAPPKSELEQRYPDRAVRQMVHANGEKMVQAVGDNAELMRQVHDLTRVDLRNALVNSGEDMGQQTVSNSKFAGGGSIGREEAFNRLLAKGLSPAEIVKLAKGPAGR